MAIHKTILPTISLFSSFSTLLCCALPALLVSLGAGAALAGLVSAIPELIWLSEHKIALFIFSGIMLTVSGISRYLSRNAACPTDIIQAKSCLGLRRFSTVIFYASLFIYGVGFFFAFIINWL